MTNNNKFPVKKTVLENGIRIVTKEMAHFRSVSLGVWVDVGARDERVTEGGLSHFIEHMIFKGTKKRTAFEIAKEFDAIGGSTNAFTSMENTCYYAKAMDTYLVTMVDILSDIFLNSLFDKMEIEKERQVILQEMGMMEDNPDEYVHQLAAKTFWGDSPLGRPIIGTKENILSFDERIVKDFFHRLYQPERIVISAAGNLNHDQLVDLIKPFFQLVQRGNVFPKRETPLSCSTVGSYSKAIEQVNFCLTTKGLPITSKKRYALSLMNTIIGGNMSSRLFQEIREKRGLAYSVYAFIHSYIDTGVFGVYACVDKKNIFQAIDQVLKEMRKLKENAVSEEELRAAKEFTKANLLLSNESNDNQMVRLAQNDINYGCYIPIEEIIENIEKITTDDILNLTRSLFKKDYLSLTMLGPVSDLKISDDILTF